MSSALHHCCSHAPSHREYLLARKELGADPGAAKPHESMKNPWEVKDPRSQSIHALWDSEEHSLPKIFLIPALWGWIHVPWAARCSHGLKWE